jgi:hypothetical protein
MSKPWFEQMSMRVKPSALAGQISQILSHSSASVGPEVIPKRKRAAFSFFSKKV